MIGEPSIRARRPARSPTNAYGWASPSQARRASGRHRSRHSKNMPSPTAFRWFANSAGMASALTSTKSPRCFTTARRHRHRTQARHDLYHRADDQRGQGGDSELPDGWTIVTRDRSLSAQWEHMVLVTETGVEVLTLSAGTPPRPDIVATCRKNLPLHAAQNMSDIAPAVIPPRMQPAS